MDSALTTTTEQLTIIIKLDGTGRGVVVDVSAVFTIFVAIVTLTFELSTSCCPKVAEPPITCANQFKNAFLENVCCDLDL